MINAYQYNSVSPIRGLFIDGNTTATTAHTINILGSSSSYTPGIRTGAVCQLGNVNFNASSRLMMESGSSLSILGNLTIASAINLDANNNSFSVGGNWTDNGTFTPGTGTVTFNTSSNSTIIGGAGGGTTYLFSEYFDDPWTGVWSGDISAPYSGLWSRYSTTFAGGTSPEGMYDMGSGSGTNKLIRSPVNTSGLSTLNLEFLSYILNLGGSSKIVVQYSTNGVNFYDIPGWSRTGGGFLDLSETVNLTLTSSEGVGSTTLYIAFTVTGDLSGCWGWSIDNIRLSYSGGMETFYGLNVAKTGTGKVYMGSDVRVTGPDHGRLILNSTSSVDGH